MFVSTGRFSEITHGLKLDRYKNHDIEVVVDKLIVEDKDDKRLKQSVATAMRQGDGLLMILDAQTESIRHYSKRLMCPVTGLSCTGSRLRIIFRSTPRKVLVRVVKDWE